MTTQPVEEAPWNPTWKPLTAEQRRVLGVLIEKAKTTPAGYPMTVNAIVLGCNQKNNRDPLMNLDDFTVERTLEELRVLGAVNEAPEATRAGSRTAESIGSRSGASTSGSKPKEASPSSRTRAASRCRAARASRPSSSTIRRPSASA